MFVFRKCRSEKPWSPSHKNKLHVNAYKASLVLLAKFLGARWAPSARVNCHLLEYIEIDLLSDHMSIAVLKSAFECE
jgi:hypothetical protein